MKIRNNSNQDIFKSKSDNPSEYAKGFSIPKPNEESELTCYLSQLEEEGYGSWIDERFVIPWKRMYDLLANEDHQSSISLLRIPEQRSFDFSLVSRGGLTDKDFSISISISAKPSNQSVHVDGAIAEVDKQLFLLKENDYNLFQKVKEFAKQPKDPKSNRLAWAQIRRLATFSKSKMDHFLAQTIVLTPETLNIEMNKVDIEGTKVVELNPTFSGAPLNWIATFDRFNSVQDHYDIPDSDGLVHVIIEPKVKTVLAEIKRMPGRRVAGVRAEAFIRNPYALLGEEATEVIPEKEFEQSLSDAGVIFSTFIAKVVKDGDDIIEVSLVIDSTNSSTQDSILFLDPPDLEMFIDRANESIEQSKQCCFWSGWELEIRGDTPDQIRILSEALIEWRKPKSLVKFKDVFDLSNYSDRIDGIGKEKPYYSPFIAKNSEDEGWFPDNVTIGIFWIPEGEKSPVGISIDKSDFKKLKEAFEKAKLNNQKTFTFGNIGHEIPVVEIEGCIQSLNDVFGDIDSGTFEPPKTKPIGPKENTKTKISLLIKPNIEKLDYEELRNRLDAITLPANAKAIFPKCLRRDVNLLDHQRIGVAWLQHLWSKSPTYCRGAVMADDMGLGKTFQLLTFVASCLEENKKLDPILIVAPVSLLDNWESEVKKFFTDSIGSIKTLYGNNLSSVKISKSQVDIQLAEKGLTNFLRPNWLGESKIVLTTYETMRDLEFSFAAQKWSIMICDEAQKIKNPNAMVTRAAKKMNVRFKVACTGTPVENSLTDLWCLFDFIQPGLLGALNQFSTRYRRRPFETNTEEERQSVSDLRKIIDPQILRRTKANVAKDLPKKLIEREYLPISNFQRTVYSHAILSFKPNNINLDVSVTQNFKNHLGLLHYLRQVCADPKPIGFQANLNESYEQAALKSPKISWLIRQIEKIHSKNEKVIIFTEFRDLQRLIQKFLKDRFSIHAEIINGDTAAVSKIGSSRQQKIDAYQKIDGFAAIILSPLAVGFGVNIQKANHVIHYTRLWNPAKEDQATDRAYRIGQTKDVYVYYPIIHAGIPDVPSIGTNENSFKTFDVKLDELLEWKRSLSDDMLNGTGDISTADFTDLTDGRGANIIEDRVLNIDDVLSMDPDAFEIFCALIWSKLGYPLTIKTPQSGDGGVDVLALNDSEKQGLLIQCKTSIDGDKRLGWDAVKDVTTGAAAYCRMYPEYNFRKICVTNNFFNSNASEQALNNNVELYDKDALEKLLKELKVTLLDLQKSLIQYL